uniref:C-type lectin domain-containing protein n=1 Tax=Varanus komodoensis TaxID=61221 RepID=A0A8D2LKA5_VARKO
MVSFQAQVFLLASSWRCSPTSLASAVQLLRVNSCLAVLSAPVPSHSTCGVSEFQNLNSLQASHCNGREPQAFPQPVFSGCKHEYCPEPCAAGWIGYEGKCYFFSEEEGNWTHGQNFCSSHGSFLARIETESEKVFLLRYKGRADHWIGLSKDQSEAWKWADGAEFRNTTDTAIVSRCHIPRHWICSHPGAAKHRYPLGE